MKRIATPALYLPDGGYLRRMVVELQQGRVVRLYPLEEELEGTTWLPGLLILPPPQSATWSYRTPATCQAIATPQHSAAHWMQQAIGRRCAYCAEFDFTLWQPVGETPHIQWL